MKKLSEVTSRMTVRLSEPYLNVMDEVRRPELTSRGYIIRIALMRTIEEATHDGRLVALKRSFPAPDVPAATSSVISFVLPQYQSEQVKTLAMLCNESMTGIVRYAIKHYVEPHSPRIKLNA